jgi:hypothetical protein
MTEQSLSPETILDVNRWEPQNRAAYYDARLVMIVAEQAVHYVEMGLCLIEVERQELYRYLLDPACRNCRNLTMGAAACPVCGAVREYFHSFHRWVQARAAAGQTWAYAARSAVLAGLEAGLGVEQMQRIAPGNLNTLAACSPAVRADPTVLEVAETCSNEDLQIYLYRAHPEQHKEPHSRLILKPEQSARAIIDDALRAAATLYDLSGREAAIEFLCASWLNTDCEVEGFEGLSNGQAWQRVRNAA